MAVRSEGTSTSHIAAETGSGVPSGAVTICQWNKLNALPGGERVLMHYNDNAGLSADIFGLDVDGSGVVDLFTLVNGVPATEDTAVHTMTEDVWYFHALVRNGSSVVLWMGTETDAVTQIGSLTEAGLGAQSSAWRWIPTGIGGANLSPDHSLERVKIYNAVLSEAEIDAERVSLTPDSSTNLWGYAAFDTYTDGNWDTTEGDGSPFTFSVSGSLDFETDLVGPDPEAPAGGRTTKNSRIFPVGFGHGLYLRLMGKK